MTIAGPGNKFTILGSSAGMPQPDRATSGYLLTVNRRHSLIDCGGGVCSSFLRRGFTPTEVDRIFITHTHPDHCTELPLFLQMLHLAGRTEPVDLYLPEEFVEPFRVILAAMYIPREKLPFEPRLHGYGDGFRFTDDFTLIAHENTHLHHNRELFARLGLPNRMQSHSFEISVGEKRKPHGGDTKEVGESGPLDGVDAGAVGERGPSRGDAKAVGERRLFYSGDIKSFDEIRPYLDGCAYVLTETTHLDLAPLIEYARTAAVGRWVFIHIESLTRARELNGVMQSADIENYVTAVDGMELPL